MRELTASLVCHAIVALKGERASVRTSLISIGVVFTGGGGVVLVVGVVSVPVVDVPPSPGFDSTANLRGPELKVTTSPFGGAGAVAAACSSTLSVWDASTL